MILDRWQIAVGLTCVVVFCVIGGCNRAPGTGSVGRSQDSSRQAAAPPVQQARRAWEGGSEIDRRPQPSAATTPTHHSDRNESGSGNGNDGGREMPGREPDPESAESPMEGQAEHSGGARRTMYEKPVFQGRDTPRPKLSASEAARLGRRMLNDARSAFKKRDIDAAARLAIEAYEAVNPHEETNADCRRVMQEVEKILESIGRQQSVKDVPTQFE